MKYDLFYPSRGGGRIHGCRWEPQGQPRAVIQIVHGIAEHVGRFEPLAHYLTGLGYVVVAEDHMGHGRSIGDACPQGCFRGGWFAAVEDTRSLMRYTMNQYSGMSYVLLGISMGSFMVRTLLAKYPNCGVTGAVLCGTAWQDSGVLYAGRAACALVCRVSDEDRPNSMLQKLMFGSYNSGIKKPDSVNSWLCRDTEIVRAYDEDPLCGFACSAGLYRAMLEGIAYNQEPHHLAAMDKALPVLFIAGDRDPVGNYGRGVEACAEAFRQAGMKNVTVKRYPEDRHDVLNELDCEKVRGEMVCWMESAAIAIKYDLMD